ncbi:uncharacterized protein METZ01_LOCUS442517, partial [marine metagenome]
ATVSPSTLTFTGINWNTDRTVTVTGVNDSDRDMHQPYRISLSAANQFSNNPEVSTFAGSGTAGSTNATGTAAKFNYPSGSATDGTNLYVADRDNHMIRKIVIATGEVSTFAGSAGTSEFIDSATATSARFNKPRGITGDGTYLYVTDHNNHAVRKINISTGAVTTIAGTGSQGYENATGRAAEFYSPTGITTDGANLYVADTNNHRIRKIVIATGVVTTFAGSGGQGAANGTGTAASFRYPSEITTDGANLYVSDVNNHT